MVRIALAFVAAGLFLSVATTARGQSPVYRSALHDYQLVTVADGLERPWSTKVRQPIRVGQGPSSLRAMSWTIRPGPTGMWSRVSENLT